MQIRCTKWIIEHSYKLLISRHHWHCIRSTRRWPTLSCILFANDSFCWLLVLLFWVVTWSVTSAERQERNHERYQHQCACSYHKPVLCKPCLHVCRMNYFSINSHIITSLLHYYFLPFHLHNLCELGFAQLPRVSTHFTPVWANSMVFMRQVFRIIETLNARN